MALEKQQQVDYTPPEKAAADELFSPDNSGFTTAFKSLTLEIPVVTDGALFRVRAFMYEESLIMGYLLTDNYDHSVIAFPHMFTMDGGIEVKPLSGAAYPLMKLYPRGSCLGSVVPDDKHTLIFLECTLARLPEMSGYFNPKRIASILAVKQGLMEKLNVSITTEGDDPPAVTSSDKRFTPPALLRTRTKH